MPYKPNQSATPRGTGKRQHVVPQMMIRRFAGDDGQLAELRKTGLVFGTRRRSPSGILFRDDFYKDSNGDLDAQLLTPVEQKFKNYYPGLADKEWDSRMRDGDEGAAFVDWVCAMLVRTPLLTESIRANLLKGPDPLGPIILAMVPALFFNIQRTSEFHRLQDVLSRPNWRWKCRMFPPGDELIITDHPVCQTNGLAPGGMAVLVPLSKQRIVIGGRPEVLEEYRHSTARHINAFLGAMAGENIFAASRTTLETLVRDLSGEGECDPEWCKSARKPHLGHLEYIRTAKPPTGQQLDAMDKKLGDLYGPSILEPIRGKPY